jgi:glucokinase-like ROK family protein
MKKASQQQIKEQNRNLVLKIIFEHESTSRAEIARISHLTRTTVSDIVNGLFEEGLVNEIGTGLSIGGKSPILLSLVDDSRHLIAVDLAQNSFNGAVVNLRGQIRELISRPIQGRDGEKSLQVAYEIIDQLIQYSSQTLVGISLATPGLVNAREGTVIQAVNLDWRNFPLGPILQERYHLPVYVFNDCQAAAMGEYQYGNYPPEVNMIVVRVGRGIGAGIIFNGQIFSGDSGHAGEIGHVVCIHTEGRPCRCGNSGCLETVSSATAVVQIAENLAAGATGSMLAENCGQITLETLEKAFNAGDGLAQQIILSAGYYLGEVIANLVGGLNVDRVILTGIMTCFGQSWLEAVQKTVRRNILPQLAQEISIEIGHLKNNEAILGAAAVMASNYALFFKR